MINDITTVDRHLSPQRPSNVCSSLVLLNVHFGAEFSLLSTSGYVSGLTLRSPRMEGQKTQRRLGDLCRTGSYLEYHSTKLLNLAARFQSTTTVA